MAPVTSARAEDVTVVPTARHTARGTRRTPVDKYDERRTQLAISALATLGELGYARTSLREIANNSEFSHGVVHYYFANKFELITHCVRHYKAQCVTRYDGLVAESTSDVELLTKFADKLVDTMATEAPMHRLWYDLRAQSMFEEQFRPDVLAIDATLQDMIGRVVQTVRRPGRTCPRRRRQHLLPPARRSLPERPARPSDRRRARLGQTPCPGARGSSPPAGLTGGSHGSAGRRHGVPAYPVSVATGGLRRPPTVGVKRLQGPHAHSRLSM